MTSYMYGSIFLKSVDTSGHVKIGEYIFNILKDVILEVGPLNVVQVCMDNATNCGGRGDDRKRVAMHMPLCRFVI